MTWTEELICGEIWICGLSHFMNQSTSLRKWTTRTNGCKHCTKPRQKTQLMVICIQLTFINYTPMKLSKLMKPTVNEA